MSGDPEHDDRTETNFSRRTFMKASGGVAGAGLLGVGGTNGAAAAADGDLEELFLNWRTVEAKKVWDRGYRGRPDRTVAINDTGGDTRHPEIGPWNGVVVEKDGDTIDLKRAETEIEERPVTESVPYDSFEFDGRRAGTGVLGLVEQTDDFHVADLSRTPQTLSEHHFEGNGAGLVTGAGTETELFPVEAADGDYDGEVVGYRVDATLTWTPSNDDTGTEPMRADFELRDADGETVADSDRGSGGTNTGSRNRRRLVVDVEAGREYRFFAYGDRGAVQWEIDAEVQAITDAPLTDDADDVEGYEVHAELATNESAEQDPDVELQLRDDDGGIVASRRATAGTLELTADVEPGVHYFRLTTWSGVSDWQLDAEARKLLATDETEPTEVVHLEDFDGDPMPDPDEITPETTKAVGWYNTGRYLDSNVPRDPNGHGTHVANIAAGSGRASTIDYENTSVEEPHAVLLPTDFVEYEVEAGAGTTVFASAFGEGIQVEVVGPDGEVLREAPLRGDSIIADAPTVHGSGTATYTVRVRPWETGASVGVAADVQEGNPAAGRLQRIAFGTYLHPPASAGIRSADGDAQAVHPGMAPNASYLAVEGFLEPTAHLNDIADDLVETFNVRAMNHSWGAPFGEPWGALGGAGEPVWGPYFSTLLGSDVPGSGEMLDGIEAAAEAGLLTVAAAGNTFTPANGNSLPAVAKEAISVVATGPFDGITSYSSGGIGGLDQDQESFHAKPDVTAPGGDVKPDAVALIGLGTLGVGSPLPSRYELVRAAEAPPAHREFADDDPPRDFTSLGGTSMASPYVCGMAGLVAQAMEEDAPDSIALPAPADTGFEDVMRLKQAILATANETAFTAAPYHNVKSAPSTPAYTHGGRDPYEGYGRANPDAAVDAVSRDLFDGETFELGGDGAALSHAESVGTYVPEDARAVAGYVTVPGGTLDVSVDFTGYSGANDGLARGDPHLDLFVYDAENPAANGEPAIVASTQAEQGTGSVSVDVDRGSREDATERTFFVVAKIVNVPGVVNGYDVQSNFDLGVSFTPAEEFPQPAFTADGTRSVGSTVMGGREVTKVEVTVSDLAGEARLYDRIPDGWTLLEGFSDAASVDDEQGTIRLFHREDRDGEPDSTDTFDEGGVSFTYFVESPDGLQDTGAYTFGPGLAAAVDADEWDPAEAEYAGTDDAVVAGVDL